MAARREPVSIICVFNDREVRRRCLDRSIEKHRDGATIEYLPIDNVDGSFASAGAALNRGAALAKHDYLVFVHQDVYLHSPRALEEAAGRLADDEGIGVIGASGIGSAGEPIGLIRDRVVLLGERARGPRDVDSVDELLFIIPRRVFERARLSEAPELAWHAYAVEYGLRARSLGLRVCAFDIPLTHNSLTVNLDRLEEAHNALAAAHPDALPVRTTCGTIGSRAQVPAARRFLAPHLWRYRWLRESVTAHAAHRASGGRCVLSDIRFDIDEVISGQPHSPLLVVNLDREGSFADEHPGPIELVRHGREIMLTSQRLTEIVDTLAASSRGKPILVTNLRIADIRSLAARVPQTPRIIGFRREVGCWMLFGGAIETVPKQWRLPRATPLGMPAIAR